MCVGLEAFLSALCVVASGSSGGGGVWSWNRKVVLVVAAMGLNCDNYQLSLASPNFVSYFKTSQQQQQRGCVRSGARGEGT